MEAGKKVPGDRRLWCDSAGVIREACVPKEMNPDQGEPSCREAGANQSPSMPAGTFRVLVERSRVARGGQFDRFEWVVPSPRRIVAITGIPTGLNNLHLDAGQRVIEFCGGQKYAAVIEVLAMQIRGSSQYWKEQRLAGIEHAPPTAGVNGLITLFGVPEDYTPRAGSQCPDGSQGKECTYEDGGKKYPGVCACSNTNLKTNCLCQKK